MFWGVQARKLERGRILQFVIEVNLEGGVLLGGGLRHGSCRRLRDVDLDIVIIRLLGREELRSGARIVISVLGTDHIELKLRCVVPVERVGIVEHGLISIPYPDIS